MALSRRIARPLLASIFVVGGLDAVRNPAGKAKKAQVVTEPLRERAGTAALDTEAMVRVNGGVQIVGGVLLATGKVRRLACLALMGSIIPTTYAGHRFWEEADPTTRSQQKMHFLKNLGLLGGLILAAVDTEGEPSLGWRAKRRFRHIEGAMSTGRSHARAPDAEGKSKALSSKTSKLGRRKIREARVAGRRARRRVSAAGFDPAQKLADTREGLRNVHDAVTDVVRESSGGSAHVVQQATALVTKAARQLEPLAESTAHSGMELTKETLSKLSEQGQVAARVLDAHKPSPKMS